jgi:uncharacterized protein (DUF4415 family)
MRESKRRLGSDFAKIDATTDEEIARQIAEDPDTAPELTEEQLEDAEIYVGDKFVRRIGRPKGSGKKELVTLRLDREILAHFRAGGPGWQTRLNETLRSMIRPMSKTTSREPTRRVTSEAGRALRQRTNRPAMPSRRTTKHSA